MTSAAPDNEDQQVRIGALAVTTGLQRLVTVGLGSCVGVVIIDQASGVYALAHVFLPEAPDAGPKEGAGPATYASDTVPALLEAMRRAGGARSTSQLQAVLAGGARMFASGRSSTADIGERNVAAVTRSLRDAGVRVVATETGGTHGRTIRVEPGREGRVTVRAVGSEERDVWTAQQPAVRERVDHAAAA